MPYIAAVGKAILIFFLLLFIMRVIGKAGFAKLSPSDATLILIIAAVIGTPLVKPGHPLSYTLLVLGTVVILQFIFSRLSLVDKLRPWLESKPTVIILDGKISFENMKNNQFDMDQLLSALRLRGIRSINEVELGTLEPSGQFSVMKNSNISEHLLEEDSTCKQLKEEALKQFQSQGLNMKPRNQQDKPLDS
ncbi:MAG: DUF421 domain-containing protein [Firmicutes bacterium]|nr:DUF421 domain-containing protein [Bacillota bacterium]